MTAAKKAVKSSYNVTQVEIDDSADEEEATVHAAAGPPPKPWNPPLGLKFRCPLGNHVHEVSKCVEFFYLTPLDRWEKIEKLKPKTVCKGKRCLNVSDVPQVLKCAFCASWAESKGLALFSILFYKQKKHPDSRASPADIRKELEKYIGKLEPNILDSKIK